MKIFVKLAVFAMHLFPFLCIEYIDGQEISNFNSYFKKKYETRLNTEGTGFAELKQLKIDFFGNFLLLDAKGSQICVFNKNGEFKKRIGRRGQGPGEFINPRAVEICDTGNIYVGDHSSRRINKYDRFGKFLSSFILSSSHWAPDEQIIIDSEKRIYIGGFYPDMKNPGNGAWVNIYDQKGKYEGSIVPRTTQKTWLLRMFPVFCFDISKDDFIYTAEIDKYLINVFNSKGNLIRTLNTNSSRFVKPDLSFNFNSRKYKTVEKLREALIGLSKSWTKIVRLEVVEKKILLIIEMNRLDPFIKKKYLIDIYDIERNVLEKRIETDFKFLCSDRVGDVYFLLYSNEEEAIEENPEYRIGCFEIEKLYEE